MPDIFDRVAQLHSQGQDVGVYEELANNFGLALVAKLATVQPNHYVQHNKSQYVLDMLRSVGGLGALVEEQAQNPELDLEAITWRFRSEIDILRTEGEDDEGVSRRLGRLLKALNLTLDEVLRAA